MALALLSAFLGKAVASKKTYQPSAHGSSQSYHLALASDCCMGLAIALVLVLLCVVHRGHLTMRAGFRTIEMATSGVTVAVMGLMIVGRVDVLAKLINYNSDDLPVQIKGEQPNDNMLMLILLAMTVTHFAIPVRWCALLPVELAGGLGYALVIFARGAEAGGVSSRVVSLVMLTAVIFTMAAAKRSIEVGERDTFVRLLTERTLRCSAEFELSQVAIQGPRPERERRSEAAESAPTTTPSGRIFDVRDAARLDPSDGRVGLVRKLEEIAERGDAEHWRIKTAEVRAVDPAGILGKGGFGIVNKATFCGMLVAVKSPLRELQSDSLCALPELCNELRVLRRLRHPNIVGTHGAVVDPQQQKVALVLEFVNGVTLTILMMQLADAQSRGESGLFPRYQILVGVCRALLYMHTRSPCIVHGDLKDSNIMVERSGHSVKPKLLDFGLSRVITRNTRSLGGTRCWMAPEVYRRQGPVKCSADVYSFGRLMAYVATGIRPMVHLSRKQVTRVLAEGRPPPPTWPATHAFSRGCCFQRRTEQCTRASEGERPPIEEVHEGLLAFAVELKLTEGPTRFHEEIRVLVAQKDGPPPMLQPSSEGLPPEPAPSPEASTTEVPQPPPQEPPPTLPRRLEGAASSSSSRPLPTLREDEPLEAAEAEVPPPPPQEGEPAKWRPFLRRMGTTERAIMCSMLALLVRWNYGLKTRPCCSLHGALNIVQAVINALTKQGCHDLEAPSGEFPTCLHCGMMNTEPKAACDGCCGGLREAEARRAVAL